MVHQAGINGHAEMNRGQFFISTETQITGRKT